MATVNKNFKVKNGLVVEGKECMLHGILHCETCWHPMVRNGAGHQEKLPHRI